MVAFFCPPPPPAFPFFSVPVQLILNSLSSLLQREMSKRPSETPTKSKDEKEDKRWVVFFFPLYLSSPPPLTLSKLFLDRFSAPRSIEHAPRRVLLGALPPRRPARIVASGALCRCFGSSARPPDAGPARLAVRLQVSFIFFFFFFSIRSLSSSMTTSTTPFLLLLPHHKTPTTNHQTKPNKTKNHSALEPVIPAEIMQLHHSKHHQAYVTNLNAGAEKYAAAEARGDVAAMLSLQPALKFNGGGHLNHSLLWTTLCPARDYEPPKGALERAIEESFGGAGKGAGKEVGAAAATKAKASAREGERERAEGGGAKGVESVRRLRSAPPLSFFTCVVTWKE